MLALSTINRKYLCKRRQLLIFVSKFTLLGPDYSDYDSLNKVKACNKFFNLSVHEQPNKSLKVV